jgi:hypothetical protein
MADGGAICSCGVLMVSVAAKVGFDDFLLTLYDPNMYVY